MRAFYCDHFVLPLPAGHSFPMEKYAALRQRVDQAACQYEIHLRIPPAASDRDLLRVHSEDYLQAVITGRLSTQAQRKIGFPWSRQMVERSRRSVGGTMAALQAALDDGVAVNLAGGTHHAQRDQGRGYCVFNDAVVAARYAQAELALRNILIIDLDVHHGDGTASLCMSDSSLFCFSMHGAKNYPARKPPSDLDVALPDETGDMAYLEYLEQSLDQIRRTFHPDAVIYLAGADPYYADRLGRLALSKAGLARRDQLVFEYCCQSGLPVATCMAGGYAEQISDIVDIHFTTVIQAVTACR